MGAGDFVIGATPFASIASLFLVLLAYFGPFPLLVLIPDFTNATDLPIVTMGLFSESSNLLPFAEIDNIRILSSERQCSCATQLYQYSFGKLQ